MNVEKQGQKLLFRNLKLKITLLEIFYFSVSLHSFRQFDCTCSSSTFHAQQITFINLNAPLNFKTSQITYFLRLTLK